jgi:hypothetical protein
MRDGISFICRLKGMRPVAIDVLICFPGIATQASLSFGGSSIYHEDGDITMSNRFRGTPVRK